MSTNGREFLGWDKPLVRAVGEYLVGDRPGMDFSDVMLVVSGGRAGRRIVALLTEMAREKKVAMIPPRIVTPGALAERLYRPGKMLAGDLPRELAWIRALREGAEDAAILFPRLNPASERGAAQTLETGKQELASGVKDFADLAGCCETVNSSGERASAAGRLHERYREILAERGLIDAQDARRQAIEAGEIQFEGTIVLAGIVEMTAQLRAMLDCVRDRARVLVFAPASLAGEFDELGCVKRDRWCERGIDISKTDWRIAPSAGDQAEEVFVSLAAKPQAAEEVTICATDEALVPHVETTAKNLGIDVRFGAGTLVAQSRPWRLLSAIAEFIEQPKFQRLIALVSHPDVMEFLRERLRDEPGYECDWLTALDNYAARFLPDRLGAGQEKIEGWRFDVKYDKYDNRANLAWLYRQVSDLCGPMLSDRPAGGWAPGILRALALAYGQKSFDQSDEAQRRMVLSCFELRNALDELRAVEARNEEMSASDAIHAVLNLAGGARIPPPMDGREIEIVGWLELLADDAARVVVAGMNDGLVPQSARPNPLLNNTLRAKLGLVTDEDRWARDAYILTAIIESRAKESVTLISGKFSSAGEPLLPSRLLFACDVKEMANRIVKKPEIRQRILKYTFGPSAEGQFQIGIVPPGVIPAPTRMNVTSFRDYIASPQGFYLKHILRLQTMAQQVPSEMEAFQCGSLVHEVMNRFAASPARDSSSAQQCIDTIIPVFHELAQQQFGSPTGVLKFQLALLEKRLERLAQWQADWAKQGWRIRQSEFDALRPLHAMEVKGRIDRIDFNTFTNTWAILDYKVGAMKKPDDTHRGSGEWKDLQLPLYRHLAPDDVNRDLVKLGYISVADRLEQIGDQLANWDAAMLQSADEKTREVIDAVRASKFEDVGDDPPTDGIFGHIFGEQLIDEEDE